MKKSLLSTFIVGFISTYSLTGFSADLRNLNDKYCVKTAAAEAMVAAHQEYGTRVEYITSEVRGQKNGYGVVLVIVEASPATALEYEAQIKVIDGKCVVAKLTKSHL